MPEKPIQKGFKVQMQAEAANGYVSGCEGYTGKKGNSVKKDIVVTVVKPLSEDMHHTLAFVF